MKANFIRKIHYVFLYLKTLLVEILGSFKKEKYCPLCQSYFYAFLPFGEKLRANAQCPRCGSLERHRISYIFLKNETDIFEKNTKMIHFAPEEILAKVFLSNKNIEYLGADINPDLPYVTKKVDIQNISYPDNSFDFVYCSHVLEHVPDDGEALSELHRILKPGGKALIIVPLDHTSLKTIENPEFNTPELRLEHYNQKDHLRLYAPDFQVKLENAGFKNVFNNFNKQVNAKKYGQADDGFYYCFKT
jgi:SAM-dependent methyltransferase